MAWNQTGVYPGSGVASGGQQGRPKFAHNGVGGARQGGKTAFSSQSRSAPDKYDVWRNNVYKLATKAGMSANNYVASYYGKDSDFAARFAKSFRTPGGVGFTLADKPLNRLPNGRGPKVPGPAGSTPGRSVSPAEKPPDFTLWRDAEYEDALRQHNSDFDVQLNPILAELDSLSAKGLSGKTMYDALYSQAQDGFGQDVLRARDDASKRGLLVSGSFDNTRRSLNDQFVGRQQDLYNNYGQGRLARLQAERDRIRAARTAGLGGLQRAASARGAAWWQNRIDSIYGERESEADVFSRLMQQFGGGE